MHGNSTPTSPHEWNPFRVFLIARLPPFKNASQNMYLFLLPLLLLLITRMDDIRADNANKKLKKNNIQRLSLLRSFKHLLGRLHSHADCHNRKLHYDQYVSLMLLYFFNPTLTGLRSIQHASTLKRANSIA